MQPTKASRTCAQKSEADICASREITNIVQPCFQCCNYVSLTGSSDNAIEASMYFRMPLGRTALAGKRYKDFVAMRMVAIVPALEEPRGDLERRDGYPLGNPVLDCPLGEQCSPGSAGTFVLASVSQ